MISISTLNKLIYRLRVKLKDTNAVTYSNYEILDALNETLRELRRVVTQFYSQFNFTVQDVTDLIETSDTGWPIDFDELINEYCLFLLLPGDYGAKEQLKILWQQKVLMIASQMSTDVNIIQGANSKCSKLSAPQTCCINGGGL